MSPDTTKKILLIDDDDDLRNLSAIYFKMNNYEVFHAIHGKEGQEQLKTVTPDLIILDMMMPVLDGMGFLRWLQQEAKLDIPVIALTGRSKSDTQTTANELGATQVVFKPCDPDKLVEYAKKIIG
jgi:DNA-binding response OmpR family regulator